MLCVTALQVNHTLSDTLSLTNLFLLSMKWLYLLMLCGVVLLPCSLLAQQPVQALSKSQKERPSLFDQLPDKMLCDTSSLADLFSKTENEEINAQLTPELRIQGTIISFREPVVGTRLITIRLSNYNNAILSVTAKSQINNSVDYQARALHPRFDDALTLTKEKDKYYFVKSAQKLLMPD